MYDKITEIMGVRFSLMTYNVHSCRGLDRKVSPQRIAEIVARYEPDIVALQELDIMLQRSDMVDQAQEIAGRLKMDYHFNPSFQLEEGFYGNAVLSRFPMRLVKAGELPTSPGRSDLEKRGALWLDISIGGGNVQLINTHLGLDRRERIAQANALLSIEWCGNPEFTPPAVMCGDFNDTPSSEVYRILKGGMTDVQFGVDGKKTRGTWPSLFAVRRIDHILVCSGLRIVDFAVPRTLTARIASDHLPLISDLSINPGGNLF